MLFTGSDTYLLIQFYRKEVHNMGNDTNTSISKILGNNIKQIRSREGISQEKLAERIGKSAHFISVLERRG